MRLYLDTSALLRAELEHDASLSRTIATAAERFSCRLLLVEVARTLRRMNRDQPKRDLTRQAARIANIIASSAIAELDERLLSRAELDFPIEPVRSLDAIHLAAALWWRERIPSEPKDPVVFASTDDRLRVNAKALGFALIPSA